MDASKLTAEQIDWVCRYPLAQMLETAQTTKRKSTADNTAIVYANARIQKVAEIYRAVGYWTDETLADEFRAERESAEKEDGGNQ